MGNKRKTQKTNSSRLNLVMLVLGYEYGGQAVSTLNLIRRLPGQGINVAVVACCPGEFCDRAKKLDEKTISLGLPKPPLTQLFKGKKWKKRVLSIHLIWVVLWLLKAVVRFFRVCRQMDIDVIHCSYAHPALIAGIVAKILGVPLICHQRFPFAKSGTFWIECVMANFVVTYFVAISNFVKSTMPQKWQHKITVIYNGIEDICPANEDNYLRKLAKSPQNSHLVGMAGTFLPIKGWDDFVQVANLAHLRHKDNLCFVAIGGKGKQDTDDYFAHLKNSVVDESVRFIGRIANANHHFKELSVFLFCTRVPGEAFGLVISEAMLSQVPVVAFSNGAALEIIEDGKTGFLVPDGDVEAMLDATRKLVNDSKLSKRMGENGRRRALNMFSMDLTAKKMAELISQVVTNSKT